MTSLVFFLKFHNQVKKVEGVPSLKSLVFLFKEKFKEEDAAVRARPEGISFYTEDKEFRVPHQIEDFGEIYQGSIVEVRVPESEEEMKRELSEMKKQLAQGGRRSPPRGGGRRSPRASLPPPRGRGKRRRDDGEEDGRRGGPKAPPSESTLTDAKPDGSNIVRMRGLPWSTTEADIREFFSGLRIAPNGIFQVVNKFGRVTGDAYVRLETPDDMENAKARHNKHMQSRYIEVYRSNEFELMDARKQNERSQAVLSRENSHLVKLRGLPWTTEQDDVRNFFRGLPVLRVWMGREPGGRPSGEAYVEFPNDEMLKTGLQYHKKTMGSRYIEVFRSTMSELAATVDSQSAEPERDDRYGGDRYGGDRYDRGGRYDRHDRGGYDRGGYDRRDDYDGPGGSPSTSAVILARGLPYEADDPSVTKFFQEAGITPIRIHRKESGGEAYVEFATPAAASKAMSRHKAYLGRRYVELFRVSYNEMADTVGLPRAPPPTYDTSYNGTYGGGSAGGGGPSGGYGAGYSSAPSPGGYGATSGGYGATSGGGYGGTGGSPGGFGATGSQGGYGATGATSGLTAYSYGASGPLGATSGLTAATGSSGGLSAPGYSSGAYGGGSQSQWGSSGTGGTSLLGSPYRGQYSAAPPPGRY